MLINIPSLLLPIPTESTLIQKSQTPWQDPNCAVEGQTPVGSYLNCVAVAEDSPMPRKERNQSRDTQEDMQGMANCIAVQFWTIHELETVAVTFGAG